VIYTIYSYWNITELTGVFNAIAALVGSPDYGGAIRFLALVAMMALAMAVLSGRGRMDEFWQWTLMAALFNGFLLAPKATVQLVDQTGTNPPAVISNVPIGLAAIASSVSTIGYWLTSAYETVYALPGDLNFEANGMMFGQRVQKELDYLKPATVAWQNDFNNYYTQCLVPDILNGTLTQDQINTSSNIWSLLGNTNPGLYVTLSTVGTVNCPAAYNDLNTRLTTSEVPATLQQFAVSALPQTTSPTLAVNGVSNTIVDSASYFYGIATSANAAVQQGMVSNSIIDAHCNMLAQTSNTALATECLTQSEGFRQTNSSYIAMANIAQSSMPKLRNAIELIQYAIFPIILIFIVVAGHKALAVLAGYVKSLVWIQLWPPLYAVVNYMMNVHAAYWGNATQGNAMALQYQQWITSSSVSDQAIAGMLVVAIPPIAWGIVKGGEIGLQAIGSLASPPHSVEKLATQLTEGNHNIGQINANPHVTTGAGLQQRVNDDGSNNYIAANGTHSYDKGVASDNMNWKAESGSAYAAKLATESKTAFSSAVSSGQQAGTQWASNWNDISSFIQQHGHDSDLTSGDNLQRMGTISNANQAMQTMTHKLMTSDGLTQSQATTVTASATAGIKAPVISAELQAQGMSKTEADHVAQEATDYASQHGLSQEASLAINAIRGLQFSDKNSSSARGAHDISAGFAKAQTYRDMSSNELRRSEELTNKAELVRSDQNTLTNDRTTQVVNSIIATSREPGGLTFGGHTYHNMTAQDIDKLMRNGDPDMQNTLRAFSEKLMDADVQALVNGQMHTENGIKADFAKNSLAASGKDAVFGANAGNQRAVQVDQAGAGVTPGQKVTNPIAGAVTGVLQQTSSTTKPADFEFGADGNTDWDGKPTNAKASIDPVMPGGMPANTLSGTVLGELNNPGTMERTIDNATASVLPDATNHLAYKYLDNGQGAYFQERSAKRYQGSDAEAVAETVVDAAIFAGGVIGAGAAGEIVLESATKNSLAKIVGDVGVGGRVVAGTGASSLDKWATDYVDGSGSNPVQPAPAGSPEAVRPPEPAAPVQAEIPAQPAPAGSPMGSQQNGVSDELASSLEKSNLGNLFGGGQAYVPPSEQQAHGEVEAKDEGELPPPSN
jgi:conjugal transfer mating pair stabilization protein TraG